MWFFDAWVHHFLEHICILSEIDEQLLFLLHVAVRILIYLMCIVEKQIVFWSQLNPYILYLILSHSALQAMNLILQVAKPWFWSLQENQPL